MKWKFLFFQFLTFTLFCNSVYATTVVVLEATDAAFRIAIANASEGIMIVDSKIESNQSALIRCSIRLDIPICLFGIL